MARKVWTFELEDGSHSVELEHGYFSGERKIRVDGIPACVLIPVIALGGAIPAMLGAAGAWGCTSIARDSTRSARMRVVLCIGLTVLCWAAFLVFAGMIGRVLPPV